VVASPKSLAAQSLAAQVAVSTLTAVPVQTLVLSELQTLATQLHCFSITAVLAAAVVEPLSGQLVVMQAPVQADASLAVHVVARAKVDSASPGVVEQVKAASLSGTRDAQE
jgi:hypothetical protein